MPGGLRRTGAEQIENLVVFGEASLLVLGEDPLAVGGYVEDAGSPLDELGFDLKLLGDLGRQTGGPR